MDQEPKVLPRIGTLDPEEMEACAVRAAFVRGADYVKIKRRFYIGQARRMDPQAVMRMLRRTRLLLGPRERLSTFGQTRIRYHLVSPVEDLEDRSRLRRGTVVSERPRIIAPDHLRRRFEGFGEEARSFGEWLLDSYGDRLRALEYRFRNQAAGTQVLHDKPARVAERIRRELEGGSGSAVLLCPDAGWQHALMKLLIDEARHSFPGHVREMEARGMFRAPDERRRDEIEELFRRAAADRSAVRLLGARLREWGLFREYEDRFLSLF